MIHIAMHNPDVYDSYPEILSVHTTLGGANRAMRNHERKFTKDWVKRLKLPKKELDMYKSWCVKSFKLLKY